MNIRYAFSILYKINSRFNKNMYRGIVSSLRKKEIVYHKKKRKSTTSIASSSTSSKKGTSNRQSTTSLVKLGSNKTLQIINLPFKDHNSFKSANDSNISTNNISHSSKNILGNITDAVNDKFKVAYSKFLVQNKVNITTEKGIHSNAAISKER